MRQSTAVWIILGQEIQGLEESILFQDNFSKHPDNISVLFFEQFCTWEQESEENIR